MGYGWWCYVIVVVIGVFYVIGGYDNKFDDGYCMLLSIECYIIEED